MNLFDQLRNAIAMTLKVPPSKITEHTKDEDIGAWDSLGHTNLMMMLEQTFGVALEVEDFPRLTSVAAIIEYLEKRGVSA